MSNHQNTKVRLGAVLVPVILLLVLFGASLLKGEIFYRLGTMDGQWFHYSTSDDGDWNRQFYYGQSQSTGPNQHSIDSSYYYRLLEEAGFNQVAVNVIYGTDTAQSSNHTCLLDCTFYQQHGIQVWNANNGRVHEYASAQHFLAGIGQIIGSYIKEPFESQYVRTTDPEYTSPPVYVFFCDADSDSAGYLILDTLSGVFDCRINSARDFHVRLILRVDNVPDSIITIGWAKFEAVGSSRGMSGSQENPFYFYPYWVDDDTTDATNDTTTFMMNITSEFDTTRYDTLEFVRRIKVPSEGVRLTIYWFGYMDLYLDEVDIFDEQFNELAFEPSSNGIRDSIRADAQRFFNEDNIYAYSFDEPFNIQHRAVGIVDTLCRQAISDSFRLISNLSPKEADFLNDYIDEVNPPVLVIATYPLKDSVTYSSTCSNDSISLQTALNLYMIQNWNYVWGPGIRTAAIVARNHGIPWFTYIQVHEEWRWINNNWDHWWRAPTGNEIFCQAYLALSYGAKGMGYYHIAPGYGRYLSQDRDTCYLRPNNNLSDSGYAASRGIFDLKTFGGEQPSLNNFPSVLHSGILAPNYRFNAIKDFHSELDSIESVLLDLDWVDSFCTDSIQSQYQYSIDSVWTVGDDAVNQCHNCIDSTFVQVGIFYHPGPPNINKYLMVVNRRCISSDALDETRTVHLKLDFGQEYARHCLVVTDYIIGSNLGSYCCTDDTGHVEVIVYDLAPGHGRLLRIFDPYTGNANVIDSGDTLKWMAGDTAWVADTLEVKGTLIAYPGAYVKICKQSNGIIIKPGGHLAILGTQENPVTIEGVNPDSLNANIKLWGSGNDTIQYCNISNLNYGVSFGQDRTVVLNHCTFYNCNTGVMSIGGGTLIMDSCNVEASHWEGISLADGDEGHIRACIITGGDECGIRLHGVKSTFKVGYNTIEANSANYDSLLEAVHTYGCSPEIYANRIENNQQDGMGMYNQSHPVMNKNPEDEGAAENRITHNGAPESNRLIYMNSSAAVLFIGHNDIFNTEPDTTMLIKGEKMPSGETYKMYNNYLGEWKDEPSWAFDIDCPYNWDPKDGSPNTESLIDDPAGFAFSQALYLENEELYTQAAQSYFNLIGNYPNSYLAQASLDRILGCYEEVNGNIPTLQSVFETIRDTTSHQYLSHKARQMAIKCLTERRQYDEAIYQLENILSESNISFEDSLYMLIDIASVHMLAYYDSLVCSWDPQCDSLAGTMSRAPSNRRLSQPMASTQSATGNNKRVSPNTNNKRIHNPATFTQSGGTQSPPTFSQVSTPEGSPIYFGGSYVMEPACYPMNYIMQYRPQDENNYRERVRNLLAELRGIDLNQNTNQAPPVPENYFLAQNYPNPFNPITTISYGLPEASHVKITVYNILGRKVITLLDTDQPAGYHRALWDSKSHQGITVSSGIYFYRLEANNFIDVKKMVLLR